MGQVLQLRDEKEYKMAKARTSTHRGKNGNAVHNNHEFMGKDKNIFIYWKGSYKGFELSGKTIEERELEFYTKVFTPMLEEQNDKYRAKRNYDRVKTIKDIYKSKRYRPTEEIIQYGGVGDRVPDKDTYKKMIKEYYSKKEKLGKGYLVVITSASHFDESTPHTHLREVWLYKDDKGIMRIGQEEALKRAGFELPNPNEPEGRYNNRLMTYTKACREAWQDICEAYGFEVERTPKPVKKRHQTVKEYQDDVSAKYFDAREDDLKAREEGLNQKAIELRQKEEKCDIELSEASQAKEEYMTLCDKKEKEFQALQDKLEAQERARQEEYDKKMDNLMELYDKTDSLYKEVEEASKTPSLQEWAKRTTMKVRKEVNGFPQSCREPIYDVYVTDLKNHGKKVVNTKDLERRFEDITKQYDNRWQTSTQNDYQA